jgi:FHS family glucose/mannose:H+ symporter-like MFS transporter
MGVGWRFLYHALAFAMLGAFLAIWFQPAPKRASASGAMNWTDLRDLLKQPAFAILCVSQGFYAGAEVGFFQWMPTYFQTLAGGAVWSGIVVSVFWASMTVGRIAAGSLLERVPLLPFGMTLAICGAFSAICALLVSNPLAVLCFVALTGLFFSGIYSVILAEAAHRFAHRAGTVFGGIAALAGIGCALSPWAVGAIGASPLGWRVGLGLSPLLAVCVAGNLLLLKKIGGRHMRR